MGYVRYCDCIVKQPMTNGADGISFIVCAKSKGGCGYEIVDSPQAIIKQTLKNMGVVDIYSPQSGEVICPECDGGCFTMVCYGGMPIEKNCDYCDGRGVVDDV